MSHRTASPQTASPTRFTVHREEDCGVMMWHVTDHAIAHGGHVGSYDTAAEARAEAKRRNADVR